MTGGVDLLLGAVLTALLAPALLLVALAIPALARRSPGELWTSGLTRATLSVAFAATVVALVTYLGGDRTPRLVALGAWFSLGEHGFAFDFLIDGVSLGFATLATGGCGVVAAFSNRYLHREPGFGRYFTQLALFVLGLTLVALAGSIEVLFVGWELLGLSSALLVGFFHERRTPVVNALRVFTVYRASDAAMLSAAVLLHHWAGSGSLQAIFSGARLPLSPERTVAITILITLAVAGKSALLPFSGWLPRSMEGPTPSSAVYYGALSIHAGCFLLLRAEPLLAQSVVAQVLTGAAGATTALYATLTARAQTDIKSALAYASLTQVGIIVVEIAAGLTSLAFVHIIGHACFRLLQFLRAPNILHDLHDLECRLQGPVDARHGQPPPRAGTLRLAALERGFVDGLVERLVLHPLRRSVGALDRFDRLLCGDPGAPRRPEARRRG